MRSRLLRDGTGVENRSEVAPGGRLAHTIGLPVVDATGVRLGVVVGRVISGTTIDLLVRRRRLFHRSRYLRLQGTAISVSGRALVYHSIGVGGRPRFEVIQAAQSAQDDAGGAA